MLNQQLSPELRPQATAHLAQTMTLLHMTTAELEASLRRELDANPALELVEELRCPSCGRRLHRLPCPACAAPRDDDAPVVFLSPRQAGLGRRDAGDEWPDDFEYRVRERLDEYLLRQIGPALAPEERPVAAYILARLDEDGLFPEATAEAAAYLHVSLAAVERVLGLIQRSDPPGVGARSPAESLLLQLDSLEPAPPARLAELARQLITRHFETLARREYGRIARDLGVSAVRVGQAARFIQRNLTPYPGRAFWGDGRLPESNDSVYREPDMIISRQRPGAGGALQVEVLTPMAGWLRVSPEFKTALAQAESAADRERWSQAVDRATLITKCLQQRNHTLQRLMGIIAVEQRPFILGDDGDLLPLTRARIARTLGVHESTISRAVAGKSVALPNGRIVPLAKFFDRSLSVRDRVRVIVAQETSPLTDEEIAGRLSQDGVTIARRTVAKYRSMLGILPAHLRTSSAPARPHAFAAQA